MSESINNFNLPVRMRLDAANRTYYTVCSGFWSTLRALLESESLAEVAFAYVRRRLPEHFVVEAPTVCQAADVAVRLLPLTRERYIWENNKTLFESLNTPQRLLEQARTMTENDDGPVRSEMEILTAWRNENSGEALLPTEGRPADMPLFVPQECVDGTTAFALCDRQSPVVVLQTPGYDYGDINLPYTDSSDWPVFSAAAPTTRQYAALLGSYYAALTQGARRLTRSHCESITEKFDFTCENDIIEACDYVYRHEGDRPMNGEKFVKTILNVPCNGTLRGLAGLEAAVQCRPDDIESRNLMAYGVSTVLNACERVCKTLPTPYDMPPHEPLHTPRGRTLENHLLNDYKDSPCLGDHAGTMYHAARMDDEFRIDEYVIKPEATLADILAEAEDAYSDSRDMPEKTRVVPDQWFLVLDSTPFRNTYVACKYGIKKYRFVIHLTADGGEVYEGPLALLKYNECLHALSDPADWKAY